jgi:hypothetical protein
MLYKEQSGNPDVETNLNAGKCIFVEAELDYKKSVSSFSFFQMISTIQEKAAQSS